MARKPAKSGGSFDYSLLAPESSWAAPSNFPSLKDVRRISLDVETCDPNLRDLGPGTIRGDGYICGLALGIDGGPRFYFPTRHQGGGNLEESQVWNWARAELNAFNGIVVGARLVYDLDHLWNYDVKMPLVSRFHDVQIAEPLLDEQRFEYNLDALAKDYLGESKREDLLREAMSAFGLGTTNNEVKSNIHRVPAMYAGPYAEGDVDLPLRIMDLQLQQLEKLGLLDLFDLESRLMPILLAVRRRGVRVDLNGAEQVRSKLVAERDVILKNFRRLAGPKAELMAPESFGQALVDRGLDVGRTAKSNQWSITQAWLKTNEGDELVDTIQAGRRVNTIITTFIDGHVLSHAVNGRIHCEFVQLKDGDGGTGARFCVAGDTILNLSCGPVKISNYTPTGHDTIITHTGQSRKILQKFYKGLDKMFRIVLHNGSTITCTESHKIMTPSGWTSVRDLNVGSSVFSYGDINNIRIQPRKMQNRSRLLFGRQETDSYGSIERDWSILSNSSFCVKKRCQSRPIQIGESSSIFSKQNGRTKSYDGEIRDASSQLHWRYIGWPRVSTTQNKRSLQVCASHCDVRINRSDENTYRTTSASYRREPVEQRSIESCFNDQCSTQNIAWTHELSWVTKIDKMGELEVWDVEVEIDHSYAAGGMFHHNSSRNPNLQNVPSRDDYLAPLVRGLFIPEIDEDWECQDQSQMEYRLNVHFARGIGATEAREKYNNDPDTDFHNLCAIMMGVDPTDPIIRKRVKGVNFAKSYGALPPKLAQTIGCTLEEAVEFVRKYEDALPFTKTTFDAAQRAAGENGFVRSVLGRYARFPLWEPADNFRTKREYRKKALPHTRALETYGDQIIRAGTYKALNNILQFSNADITKKAMVDIWEAGLCAPDALGLFLLQVHDELDYSVPRTSRGNEAAAEAKHIMETGVKLRVPIIVKAKRGKTWGACA